MLKILQNNIIIQDVFQSKVESGQIWNHQQDGTSEKGIERYATLLDIGKLYMVRREKTKEKNIKYKCLAFNVTRG